MNLPNRLGLWSTILRVSLQERLVYRADFALGTLIRFMPIITQILLFQAIFTATKSDDIAGYSYGDIIAYYLLVMVSRALSSMPTLASGIAFDIREGEIKKYLIQPIDMIGFLFLKRIAWKLVYYLIAFGPFALVFYLCRGFFPNQPDGLTWATYLASLLMAFALGFFLEATIGMIGFWFLEVSSLLFVYMLLNFLLSGHMFPLDMLEKAPGFVQIAFQFLPLQYLAYFPAAVFLGKIDGPTLLQGLSIQLGWVVFFLITCRLGYHYGLKRYSGYGG